MNTTVTFKTPKKLRDDAKKTVKALGIPLSTYLNSMLMQLVREQSVMLSTYPIPRPEKIAEWNKIGDDMDAHPEKYPVYTLEELFAHWDKLRSPRKSRASRKSARNA